MCAEDAFPSVSCVVQVISNREIAPAVFELVVDRNVFALSGGVSEQACAVVPAPAGGQFFMLRARPSGVLLGRPISVYLSDEKSITFLILKKGQGTAELCGLRTGDSLDLVGPVGNNFLSPDSLVRGGFLPQTAVSINEAKDSVEGFDFAGHRLRVAVIGGGIGIAPVAGFSLSLPEKSFDFFASFRFSPYGLELVEPRARKLFVTTEDGSSGVKGMLPEVFDSAKYDLVYACGPTPMLRYVKETCSASASARVSSPLTFLSLEEHMACGAGACLGCTVRTVNGNRRCCVDGPVFNAAEVRL